MLDRLATTFGEVFLNLEAKLDWFLFGTGTETGSNFRFFNHSRNTPMLPSLCSVQEAFEIYRNIKWSVIAVVPGTKIPRFPSWNNTYYPYMHQAYIGQNPKANIGLLLGRIIDIEADNEESENKLNSMFKNVPHLQYRSGRGTHHLFLNKKTNFKKLIVDGVEYRGYSHHSLLPPSIGPSGFQYEWSENSTELITPLPKFIENKILKYHCEKGYHKNITCKKCQKQFKIAAKRLNLEMKALSLIKHPWKCHGCREWDLRKICRLIRKNQVYNERDIVFKSPD